MDRLLVMSHLIAQQTLFLMMIMMSVFPIGLQPTTLSIPIRMPQGLGIVRSHHTLIVWAPRMALWT